jgi:hypothetical protein
MRSLRLDRPKGLEGYSEVGSRPVLRGFKKLETLLQNTLFRNPKSRMRPFKNVQFCSRSSLRPGGEGEDFNPP